MNRREILRYTAWITGAAVSAPLAGAILSGCSEASNNPQADTKKNTDKTNDIGVLHYFSPDKFLLLTLLADTLLPRTDSPSASDVKVPARVDSMIGLIFDEDYRSVFKLHWLQLENYLREGNFAELEDLGREQLLRDLELGQNQELASARACLTDLKQQVVAYYLTTEEIGEKYLNYVPIPGNYEPCISVEEVNNRAWAIK